MIGLNCTSPHTFTPDINQQASQPWTGLSGSYQKMNELALTLAESWPDCCPIIFLPAQSNNVVSSFSLNTQLSSPYKFETNALMSVCSLMPLFCWEWCFEASSPCWLQCIVLHHLSTTDIYLLFLFFSNYVILPVSSFYLLAYEFSPKALLYVDWWI